MEAVNLLPLMLLSALSLHDVTVTGDECGTRFTDFLSSVVLAEVVLQGSVMEFNPSAYSRTIRSAHVNVSSVFKGMNVLKTTGRMNGDGQVHVQSFGQENKVDCVAPEDDKFKNRDMVYFLRQSRDVNMMEHSALPLPAEGNVEERIRQSLCETCIQPPRIRRVVCTDCTSRPTIRPMKSKKTKIGRRAKLRCSVRGKPTPTIRWFKDDVPVVSGNGGVTIRTVALTSTLHFSGTTSAHNGRYKCVASNGIGNTEDFVTLEVTRKTRKKQGRPTSRSVKDSPDRVECQTNLCVNGGTCFFSASLNLRQCVCRTGFEGVKCENVQSLIRVDNVVQPTTNTTVTTTSTMQQTTRAVQREVSKNMSCEMKDMCINGGKCMYNPDLDMPFCICLSGFIGKNCEIAENINTTASLHENTTTIPTSLIPKSTVFPKYNISQRTGDDNGVLSHTPCASQTLCLNGGKCLHNSYLDVSYCHCPYGFHGSRCESLRLSSLGITNTLRSRTHRREGISSNSQSNSRKERVTIQYTRRTTPTSTDKASTKEKTDHLESSVEPTSPSGMSTSEGYHTLSNVLTTRDIGNAHPRSTTHRYSSNGQSHPDYPVRRKSSLKITFCRDKNYCQNRGKCKYIRKINKKFCQCLRGYGGLLCEQRLF